MKRIAAFALPLIVIGAFLAYTPLKEHYRLRKVTYHFSGKASGKSVTIRYLEKPIHFGDTVYFSDKDWKTVHLSTHALPWSKTVYLPLYSVMYVLVLNDDEKPSDLRLEVDVDGRLTKVRTTPSNSIGFLQKIWR